VNPTKLCLQVSISLAHTFAMSLVLMMTDTPNHNPSLSTFAFCMVLVGYCGLLFLPLSCLTGYHIHIIR
jgi:cyanate permease